MFDYLSVIQQRDLSKVNKFYMRGQHMGFVQNERVPLLALEAPQHFVQKANGLHLSDIAAASPATMTEALALGHQIASLHNDTSIHSPEEDMVVSFTIDPTRPDAKRARKNNVFSLPYYGAHLNLYSRDGNDIRIWLAKRSQKVFTYKEIGRAHV